MGPRGPMGPMGPMGAHRAHGAHQPVAPVDLAPRAQNQPVLKHHLVKSFLDQIYVLGFRLSLWLPPQWAAAEGGPPLWQRRPEAASIRVDRKPIHILLIILLRRLE